MAVSCITCGAIRADKFRVVRDLGQYRVVAVEGLTKQQATAVAAQLNLALRNEAWKIELEA